LGFLHNRIYRFINFSRKLKFFLNEKSSELFDRFLLWMGVKETALSAWPDAGQTIIFAGLSLNHRVAKNIKYLKQSGKYHALILRHKSDAFNDFDSSFYSKIIYRNKFHLQRLLAGAGKFRLIYAYASKPSYARVAIAHAGCKTIFDPYDCWIVYYGKNPAQEWMKKEIVDEEYCFTNSTGIAARNLEAKKSMQIFNLQKKKNVLFSDYCDNDYFISPANKEFSTVSLVYSGGIYGRHMMKSSHGIENFFDFIDSMQEQQIELNIYPSPQTKPEVYYDYIEESKKSKYLKMHPTVPQKELAREISKYHFGVSPHFKEESSRVSKDKLELGTSLKFFNFLEAGLPVLMSSEMKYMAWLVERYKIGIVFSRTDIPALSQIIKSFDYSELQKNVLKVREKLSMKSNMPRLINFIENL
jgi:hypothetical protein